MKRKSRKFTTLIALVFTVIIASSLTFPSFAYWSGDREILYYNFELEPQITCAMTSSTMTRLYDRQWAVTVTGRSNNQYPITYGILAPVTTEWTSALVSKTVQATYTGNFGSTYYSNASVGSDLAFGIMIHQNDMSMGVVTSGQWSTDAYNYQ